MARFREQEKEILLGVYLAGEQALDAAGVDNDYIRGYREGRRAGIGAAALALGAITKNDKEKWLLESSKK